MKKNRLRICFGIIFFLVLFFFLEACGQGPKVGAPLAQGQVLNYAPQNPVPLDSQYAQMDGSANLGQSVTPIYRWGTALTLNSSVAESGISDIPIDLTLPGLDLSSVSNFTFSIQSADRSMGSFLPPSSLPVQRMGHDHLRLRVPEFVPRQVQAERNYALITGAPQPSFQLQIFLLSPQSQSPVAVLIVPIRI